MSAMFQRLTILFVLLTLLAACGGAPAAPAPTDVPIAAPTDAPAVPAPTSAPAAPDRTTLIAEGIAKARAFTPILTPAEVTDSDRLIVQPAFGDARVPLQPQRIVTLDPSLTDAVIALGYGNAIVGTIVDYNGEVFHEHIAELLPPDAAKLGLEGSPNLERIVALNPDLILTWDWYPDNIPELQQIAPTAVMPYNTYEQQVGDTYSNEQYVTWLVREVAAVLGVEERVDAALQPFRDAVAQARPRLSATLGEQTVGFVDIRQEKILISGYGSDGISALLYGDLGVRPDPLSETLYVWEDLSLENIPDLTSDQILAFVDGADAQARYEELTQNPLWQRVPAVQNGKVFIVPSGLYYRGDDGPLGSVRVIDDIVQKLTGAPLDPAVSATTRTITHAMGVTEVPAVPQRVVVLDTSEVDNALALGAPIVGAPVAEVLEYQSYLADQFAGITDIGTISEPNLEAILALKPDLILGSKQRYEAIYSQLSAIAPTVFVESLRVPWQQNFRLHAEALGKTAEAEALLAAYDQRVAELQATLGPERAETTISVIRFRPGQVRLYLKSSFIGYILQDVGLGRPASQDQDTFSAEITLEQIADVDADYLFITGYAQDDSELDTFLTSPLWQTLGAVQADRAIDVDDDHWIAGLGVQAANLVLDDLERLVTP
jgi:iron complex transport system substrate-binding protein